MMALALLLNTYWTESHMHKLPRDPHKIICKYGFAAILLVELYKFIRFIAS